MNKLTVMGCLEGLAQDDWQQWYSDSEVQETAKTALALLKEQKPIYSEEKFGDHLPHCPVCKRVLPSVSQYGKSNFCYNRGQAIKW